jgi:hypothetical protein
MKINQVITVGVLVLVLVVGMILLLHRNSDPRLKGLRQVKSYSAGGICQSVNDPECGYCPGTIIDNKCYVKKGAFKKYD